MGRTRTHLWILLWALASVLAYDAAGKECTECHGGQDQKAPTVNVGTTSAHATLECAECHAGVKLVAPETAKPHGEKVRPVQCKTCHDDQATAFNASSHAEKMKGFFDKGGGVAKPASSCVACHASDAHNIVKVKDPAAPSARTNVAATCLKCHESGQPIAVDKYVDSVHGTAMTAGKTKAAVCTDCHGGHAINHSRLPNSSVYHSNLPQTCGKCHPAENSEYMASIHWASVSKGFREAPVCTDCHGEHSIRSRRDPLSSTWAGNVTKTCASCHGSERLDTKFMITPGGVESLKESFHGISSNIGDIRVANCSSCHGNHMILPRSDPRSFVNPANLGRTCGMCHPGAEQRFIGERIHTTAKAPSHWIVGAVRTLYIWLIVLTIGGMLAHSLLDLWYKSTRGLPYHKHEVLDPRFSVQERVQHALLALCFILLAISGFARKFPESPLNWPFLVFDDSADARRLVHRVAAFAFIALGLYHMIYLLAFVRGRQQFKELRPCLQDALDVKNVLLKYLGFSKAPLQMPHYGYPEKAEYWALIWGSLVMTATGLVLLFVNISLARVPLWMVDLVGTIHLWEALLAVLAIMVWHGYWSVFDPEYYPMNMTWLIGRPRPKAAEKTEPQTEPPPQTAPAAGSRSEPAAVNTGKMALNEE